MLGVYLFADAVMSSLVVLTLLAMWLQSRGLLRGVITKEHYHDLGKLTFTFVFFWGYIAFSQYMLIWYANIPEETQFFMPRQIGPWVGVSLALIVVHFVLPFLGLMSKHAKRILPVFSFWLIWLLVAHAFDLFWLIMPNVFIRQIPAEAGLGPARRCRTPSRHCWSRSNRCINYPRQISSLWHALNAPLRPGRLPRSSGCCSSWAVLFGQHRAGC